jgi:hypothetical protein
MIPLRLRVWETSEEINTSRRPVTQFKQICGTLAQRTEGVRRCRLVQINFSKCVAFEQQSRALAEPSTRTRTSGLPGVGQGVWASVPRLKTCEDRSKHSAAVTQKRSLDSNESEAPMSRDIHVYAIAHDQPDGYFLVREKGRPDHRLEIRKTGACSTP